MRNLKFKATHKNGKEEWFITTDGIPKRHREDGPALIDPENGLVQYWLNGVKVAPFKSKPLNQKG